MCKMNKDSEHNKRSPAPKHQVALQNLNYDLQIVVGLTQKLIIYHSFHVYY